MGRSGVLRTTLPQLPQFSGSICLSTLFRSTTIVVLRSVTVLVLAADVTVVIAYALLVVVALAPAVGNDRQPHAELTREHAKPFMGAPLHEAPRCSISLADDTECAGGVSRVRLRMSVGSANFKARPMNLGLSCRLHTVLTLDSVYKVLAKKSLDCLPGHCRNRCLSDSLCIAFRRSAYLDRVDCLSRPSRLDTEDVRAVFRGSW